MLHGLLKIWVRLGLYLFARKFYITGAKNLAEDGPLVLSVNHPNSFLDAILLGAFMHQPVYYLARGDVFKLGWVRAILTRLNMLPIYRIRDGKEMLNLNDQTFESSREVLRKNGILLVFVEGFCEHQTTLQLPLKKGAPRVIDDCWRKGIPVKVLPVWLQYSSFTEYPKVIEIKLGAIFGKPRDAEGLEPALVWNRINEACARELKNLESKQCSLSAKVHGFWRALLFLPALLAAVLHARLYIPAKAMIQKATRDNVHFDSALFAVLLLLYPAYLVLLAICLSTAVGIGFIWMPLLLMPLLARAYMVWRCK